MRKHVRPADVRADVRACVPLSFDFKKQLRIIFRNRLGLISEKNFSNRIWKNSSSDSGSDLSSTSSSDSSSDSFPDKVFIVGWHSDFHSKTVKNTGVYIFFEFVIFSSDLKNVFQIKVENGFCVFCVFVYCSNLI